jgi:hypothetical protein
LFLFSPKKINKDLFLVQPLKSPRRHKFPSLHGLGLASEKKMSIERQ